MNASTLKLQENIHLYQFQQAMRLLDQKPLQQVAPIKFSANNQVTFPGADIQAMQILDKGQVKLSLNFMGLYGVDSPLPHYLNQMAVRHSEPAQRLRAWLDTVHQTVYGLFYQAWKQRRIYVQLNNNRHFYYHHLNMFAGGMLQSSDRQEFSQAAILGARVKTATGLASGLKTLLKGITVSIKQFQPSQIRVSQNACLGKSNMQLADNILLGNQVTTVQNRIAIDIGPVGWQQAKALWPNSALAQQLHQYIKRYLRKNMRYHLLVNIIAEKKPLMCLGKTNDYLAWSSWLGQPLTDTYTMQLG